MSMPKRFAHWATSALMLLLAMATITACQRAPSEDAPARLTIAAASDLRFAMDELIADFIAQRAADAKPIDLRVTYGSSGNFYAQLTQRAPFDMYFSADILYPTRLAEAGLAIDDSLFEYAIGRLVVWVPNASPLDVEILHWRTLKSEHIRHIAIANPDHAPYGKAALAAMKTAGLYDDVSKKLVKGENIAQAAQFIESGAADTGIIALALALSPAMAHKGRYWEVPPDTFPTMVQGGLITRWTKHPEAAREFRAYVLGERGRRILEESGFFLPDH